MESGNPTGLGRISHVVLESRDLDRTLDFHGPLLALDPIYNADIPKDLLVFRQAGGGRIMFQKIAPDAETRGGTQWFGVHSALTIRTEDWDESYGRVWAGTKDGRKYMGYKDAPDVETRRQLVEPFTSHPGSVLRGGNEHWDRDLAANGEAVGLLVAHCRDMTAFFHCSSTAVYEPAGSHRLRESDALGDSHRSIVGDNDRIKEIETQVEKRETVETPKGKYDAWKLNTVSILGGLFKDGGQFKIWLSADERKIPVQFEAKVSLGKVSGKLKELQP